MMRLLRLALILVALALPALAQDEGDAQPALLVADSVFVEGESLLVATGNVEVLQGDIRMTATAIRYDDTTGDLQIEGPIRLVDGTGNIVVADAAELDRDLMNGLLTGARMVLDQQLQLAAVEARRVEGRYTQLSKVAVTSCQVCEHSRTPLWQIRARRVIHDEQERQLYFDEAQLRVLDVPIFYLPRMRLPDPTLERARGFLIPVIRSSSILGFGIKTPYFIPLGDHQDITLTPYLAPRTRTLEYRYRRAFHNGDLLVEGALSSDNLMQDTLRGYLFAEGNFDLRNDFKLEFAVKAVSDIAYLNDYGIPGGDRLDSKLSLTRTRWNSLIEASVIHYQSLRAAENDDTQPTVLARGSYERRIFPRGLGGEFRTSIQAQGHLRWSSRPVDGPDPDLDVDGRDVTRVNAELSWRNRWTLAGGLRAGVSGHLWLDHYSTAQDATAAPSVSRAIPGLAVELRLPLARRGALGGRSLLEPILMAGYTGGDRLQNPNDESTRVEFDQGNLLSLSRFPAPDRREHGLTGVAGLRWLHQAPSGWTAQLSLGRVWRETADPAFSRSSGLEGNRSDWLIAGAFMHPAGLSLSARGLLDTENRLSKAEARAGFTNDRFDVSASYLLLTTDLAEDRPKAQSEWTLDGSYRINRHWSTSVEARYDLADRRLDRTGLGLQYQNECVLVDISASRKFASATNLEPSTDFDLSVALKGFSTGGSAKEYRRTCAH